MVVVVLVYYNNNDDDDMTKMMTMIIIIIFIIIVVITIIIIIIIVIVVVGQSKCSFYRTASITCYLIFQQETCTGGQQTFCGWVISLESRDMERCLS